ncbi:hypothetical protein M413DRAFT_72368 [Hebeloma cylindrosporum]|uniref:Uncharacterized protein n=1 Tax=Hebeloma cylindrosporum TaxID=76867 RepID=A0A0C2YJB3_HEBCY|nr:hypothetical protein M413DRAFT_72368 [Hebeloma cylindrosporum h7]
MVSYRAISTFGHGTIRNFAANSSEMKKLAARDFEDLLQCSIPAFEGLLEEPHNRRLMKLLYRTAEWHPLAKLRKHSDSTLVLLDELTTEFGKLIRQFRDLSCTQFKTVELPRETAARKRKQTRKQAATHDAPQSGQPASNSATNPSEAVSGITQNSTSATVGSEPHAPKKSGTRAKVLNLFTVKLHFLGDYVRHIRLFGTTDSYSTQLVPELMLSIQLDSLILLL